MSYGITQNLAQVETFSMTNFYFQYYTFLQPVVWNLCCKNEKTKGKTYSSKKAV